MTDIFDTHAHYCSRQFEPDRDALMQALLGNLAQRYLRQPSCDVLVTS